MKVICNQANKFDVCGQCYHSKPHDEVKEDMFSCGKNYVCWLDQDTGNVTIRVKCVKLQREDYKNETKK